MNDLLSESNPSRLIFSTRKAASYWSCEGSENDVYCHNDYYIKECSVCRPYILARGLKLSRCLLASCSPAARVRDA